MLETVVRAARRIHLEMRRRYASGLTVPQFRALRYIERNPDTDLTGLATFLGMSRSSASPLVRRLERSHLVERSVDPGERRRHRLRLTEAGQGVVDEAVADTRVWLAGELATLAAPDRRRLAEGLAVLDRVGLAAADR